MATTAPAKPNQLIQVKRDVRDLINSDHFKAEIAKVLPKHLTPERMTRVALTAFLKTPALLSCTQESLTNALLICSQAGLEPDGRLAHLIPYGNAVTVIFDYKGLVTLALRNGAEAVYADKVCEADVFDAIVENGIKKLTHKPDFRKARGDVVCYYAVIQRGGITDWEVMTTEEVDAIRNRSKAGKNGPWVTDYDEMAKKTVLRRMSKRWDLLPEIRDVINADDDVPVEIKAPIMKPVFDAPADTSSAPEGEPESTGRVPAGDAPETTIVKSVRNLCKISNITEGKLMDFLSSTGSTDGSVGTLEELALYQDGGVIKSVYENWPKLAEQIKGAK